ncbi:MAG: ribosome biogenesis GTPase Der [Rickettsiales bacterium]|nr:ribosome biogenesis GTPase Der [Rickettsiales bacterium]
MCFNVIILGKPNVGKSCLFNALLEKNLALVKNYSGLTRDLKKIKINYLGKSYNLTDSAGIQKTSSKTSDLNKKILELTMSEVNKSNLILFVMEGNKEFTCEDLEIVKYLRRIKVKKLLIINKSEGKLFPTIESDIKKIGLGEPLFVSAEHKIGITDLKLKIDSEIPEDFKKTIDDSEKFSDHSVAIVGKTNTGKSTLLNSLVGKKLSVTGNIPHITRDPVEANLVWKNLNFRLFDTAGMTRSKNKTEKINLISINETKRRIRLSEVIILLIDINSYFEKFNYQLIKLIVEEARCLIIVINKIDKIKKISKDYIKKNIYNSFPEITNCPIFFISALQKKGLEELVAGIINVLPIWQKRINTNKLNKWLSKISKITPPSLNNGKQVKLKYITQVNTRPPKFILFTNYPLAIKENYKRFLINNLKKVFKLEGIIITLKIVKSDNPYG